MVAGHGTEFKVRMKFNEIRNAETSTGQARNAQLAFSFDTW